MCKYGDTLLCSVRVPAHLSATGAERFEAKLIDHCIAVLVEELNRCKEFTAGSCCGHGTGPGSIIFHDGRELTIKQAEDLLFDHGVVLAKYLHAIDPAKRAGATSVYYREHDLFAQKDQTDGL